MLSEWGNPSNTLVHISDRPQGYCCHVAQPMLKDHVRYM